MPHQAGTTDGEIGTAAAAAAATAAAGPAWRQFSFFESSPVRDLDDFSKAPSALRHPNEVAAVCQCPVRPPASVLISSTDPNPSSTAVVSTSVHFGADPSQSAEDTTKSPKAERKQPCTLVGTIQGRIKVLDPETFQELSTWDAFSSAGVAGRVTHLSCDTRGRVVSLGEEESSRFPILRIWDLRSGRTPSNQTAAGAESNDASATTQKVAWMPRLLAEGKVQHGSRPHPIAAVTHTPSLSYLSVALADGTVLLIRGLESALMSAASNAGIASAMSLTRPTPAIALPKFKVVFQPTSSDSGAHEPVTALGFSEAAAPITVHTTAASKKDNSGGPAYEPRVMHSSRGRKGAASRSRDPRNASNANSAATTQPETTVLPSAVHLFIVTLSRVLRYVVAGKGAGGSPAVLDDVGGALGCAAVIPPRSSPATPGANASGLQLSETQSNMGSAGKMVIARNEAIYVIGQEGREACFAYEGPKSSIHLSASQVIIVSPPYTPSTSASSSSARNLIGNRDSPLTTPTSRKGSMIPAEIAKVTIFDLDNKLVAFTGTFETGIREAWVGSAGEVLILADTGELTRLDEKPLRAKLDVLYRKSLFLLAVNLARSHMQSAANQDVFARTEALMGDIYQRYGDHLYNKGDYDGAMAQYVKTIGHTQPSFVIRRFLDAQRITNLTTYLQELHTQNLASSDHTTLLLNCYTKLKDVASLDKFIKRPHVRPSSAAAAADEDGVDGEGAAEDRDELPFDLETAMRVCRQAGYFGHAAYLAKRYGEHREYLRIQIEDAKDYSDALLYVRGLEAEDAIASMVQYAKTLLEELPDETTELLIELCSGAFRPDPDAAQKAQRAQHEESEAKEQPTKSAAAAYLSYLQVGGFGKTNNSADATTAGSAAGASSRAGTGSNTPARRNSTALVEPYTVGGEGSGKNATRPSSTVKITGEVDADASSGDAADASGVSGVNTEQDKMDAYPVPSPRTYFAHFIQHRQHFTRFLEVVALARWGQVVNMDGELPADHTLSPVQAKNAPAYSEKAGGEEDMDDVERALRELGLDSNDEDAYENQELLDQKSIWNTLLELYLSSCSPSGSQRQRALRLLQQHSTLPYDMSHAVMLCSMENFDDGLILLYERMGMYEEVVRLHMDSALVEEEDASGSSSGKVIAALARYGSLQPELYDLVLRFLVSSPILLSRHTSDLLSILNVIREKSLMSTLEIVQTLSSTPHTQVGVIRDFIISSISSTLTSTSHDAAAIADYKQSTTETLREISELTYAGGTRVFQMTRCTACGGQLDLPSVHFMCKHSYHQRCLGEEEAECGACAVHQRRVRDARRRMAQEAVEVIEKARHDGPTQIRLRADHTDAEAFDQLAAWFGLPIMGVAHAVEM